MKILLRSFRTGDYVQSFEAWTAHACAALDFQSISRALKLVRRRGLEDMEVVLTDLPRRNGPVALGDMTIAQLLAHHYSCPAARDSLSAANSRLNSAAP